MDKKAFIWLGILTIIMSFVLLSSYSFEISTEGFVVFVGIMMMPISMASFAAGLLEGSGMRIFTIFLIYLIFFGLIFLAPNIT